GSDALAHWHRAGVDRDAPGSADADDPRLEPAAAGALDAVADTDAEIAALGARLGLASGKARIVQGIEHELLTAREIAAVDGDCGTGARFQRCGVGNFFCRHEVAPPHLGAIEVERARD